MADPGCPWCGAGNKQLCATCRAKALGFPDLTHRDLDALPYGVIELDAEGHILSYNQAEEALSRIPRQRAVGQNFFEDIAPCADVKDFRERFARFLAGTEPLTEFGFTYNFQTGPVRVHLLFVRLNTQRGLLVVSKRLKDAVPTV